jgi:hypothetical protein
MTETLTKIIINCSTGEESVIPLTAEEIIEKQAAAELFAAQEAERIAAEEALAALKTSARAKLVAGEPLTEEEAATLVI